MPYARNGSVQLFWEEYGSGPPVLLIMGLSFTHEMWFRAIPWVARGYRVIAFDNRGMGRSDVPRGPYTIRQMAGDAAAVLDAAGIAAAHVIGASMGGMIAQELALRFPERVLSLVLACTTHGGVFSKWPEFIRRPWSLRNLQRAGQMIPFLYAGATPRERIDEDLRMRAGCTCCRRGVTGQIAAVMGWSSRRRLSRIRVPTLVIHGDDDRIVPPDNGRALVARIPGAQFQLVHQAGHILLTDQPEACAEAVLNFFWEQREPNRAPDSLSSEHVSPKISHARKNAADHHFESSGSFNR